MKHLLVIHTGGTISMEADDHRGTVGLTNVNPLTQATNSLRNLAIFSVIEAFHKPSPHMTVNDMLHLKSLIETEGALQKVDGVVITHGTDTLEETAFFLDLTIKTNIPIVVTGAMRSSNEMGTDGLNNLLAAVRVAISEEAKGKGVLVVFNDEIHTAAEVTKTHTTNVSAFESVQSGPVGMITNQSVIFHFHPFLQKQMDIQKVTKRVGLIKAYAGMDSSLLTALYDMSYDGLVIEALGQGNLPPDAVQGIEQLVNNDIPVVLVSRCMKGIVQDTYHYTGGGNHLRNLGVLFAKGLNGQKARLKLLAALMHTSDRKELEQLFA